MSYDHPLNSYFRFQSTAYLVKRKIVRLPYTSNACEIGKTGRTWLKHCSWCRVRRISCHLIFKYALRHQSRVNIRSHLDNLPLGIPSRHPRIRIIEVVPYEPVNLSRNPAKSGFNTLTILQRRRFAKLLYRPCFTTPSDDVNQRDLIGEVEILTLRKTFHRIDEEDRLVVVLTGERMSALDIPVDRLDDVGKEAGKAARFKIAEDGIDVGSRCVSAICCCRCCCCRRGAKYVDEDGHGGEAGNHGLHGI